ncbi:winged helix-turn-helix domain-containing protein [Pyrococcus kukulkanii]|uniref:winged helix-turn-helix domain-containing protein n=2 Tax=Pyrococcus kukulkanii TaxID=1609559 RepID=UPI001D11B9DF
MLEALEKPMSSKELAKATNLSERTVRYALKVLKDSGIIREIYLLEDARKRLYMVNPGFKLEQGQNGIKISAL